MSDILYVPDYLDNPARQEEFREFQVGVRHGMEHFNAYMLGRPHQQRRLPPLAPNQPPNYWGFRAGIVYYQRAQVTRVPMKHDEHVWRWFRRYERQKGAE